MKAKTKRKVKAMVKKEAAPAAEAAAGAKPQLLHVKAGQKYRGAREAWYGVLMNYNGKPVDDFLAVCKEKPPSLTRKGEAENPQGWLRFFQRVGVVEVKPL